MKFITVKKGQSSMDIAIQEYGCVEGHDLVVKDNLDQLTSVTQIIEAGMKLKIRTPVPKLNDTNLNVMRQYAEDGTVVANGSGESLFIFDFIIH